MTENRHIRAELRESFETRSALETLPTLHPDLETAQHGFVLTSANGEQSRDRAGLFLVERHQGRLSSDSDPGRGTVFHVDLPLARSAEHQDHEVAQT